MSESTGRQDGLGRATALWAVLGFTFANSVGAGIVDTGVFFITKRLHGLSDLENYGLATVIGVTYVAGALGIGPALKRAVERFAWLTSRRALALLLGVMGSVCWLPIAATWATPGGGEWAFWVLVAVFNLACGGLWPIVESYLSGGRRQRDLRRAIGAFNMTWSAATASAFVVMGVFMAGGAGGAEAAASGGGAEAAAGGRDVGLAQWLLPVLGTVHLGAIGLLRWFGAEPAAHSTEAHEPHPPVYEALLPVCRWMLALSYLVMMALMPMLPTTMAALDLDGQWTVGELAVAWGPPITAVWMVCRCGVFAGMAGWADWHGRWSVPIGGLGLMLSGFAAAVLSGVAAEGARGLGVGLLFGGLGTFGVGMAVIYAAALYYAQEVGSAAVEAGGAHEAAIGVGYTVGPAIGLAAVLIAGRAEGSLFAGLVIGPVVALCVGVTALVAWRVVRRSGPGKIGAGV